MKLVIALNIVSIALHLDATFAEASLASAMFVALSSLSILKARSLAA